MPHRTICLLLVCLLTFSLAAQQPAKRVKKRARNRTEARANQRIDQKMDAGVDKAFDAIEGLFKKKNKDSTATTPTDRVEDGGLRANDSEAYADEEEGAQAMRNALGLGSDTDWEPYTNAITFSLTMVATETKRNGRQEVTAMQIGATDTRFAMVTWGEGSERSQMILNTEDGKATTITTDKKGKTDGFRMRMPNFSALATDVAQETAEQITITETDQHRTIDGYACTLVIVEDRKHGTTTESWVTPDIGLTARDVFGGMAGLVGAGRQVAPGTPDLPAVYPGFPIESSTDDGKTITTTKMQDIKIGADAVDRSLFDTGGVAIRELGF